MHILFLSILTIKQLHMRTYEIGDMCVNWSLAKTQRFLFLNLKLEQKYTNYTKTKKKSSKKFYIHRSTWTTFTARKKLYLYQVQTYFYVFMVVFVFSVNNKNIVCHLLIVTAFGVIPIKIVYTIFHFVIAFVFRLGDLIETNKVLLLRINGFPMD